MVVNMIFTIHVRVCALGLATSYVHIYAFCFLHLLIPLQGGISLSTQLPPAVRVP